MEKLNIDNSYATSEAQRKASKKYLEKNNLVELTRARVSRDEKADYMQKVKDLGYSSFTKFVLAAINEKLSRECK